MMDQEGATGKAAGLVYMCVGRVPEEIPEGWRKSPSMLSVVGVVDDGSVWPLWVWEWPRAIQECQFPG